MDETLLHTAGDGDDPVHEEPLCQKKHPVDEPRPEEVVAVGNRGDARRGGRDAPENLREIVVGVQQVDAGGQDRTPDGKDILEGGGKKTDEMTGAACDIIPGRGRSSSC